MPEHSAPPPIDPSTALDHAERAHHAFLDYVAIAVHDAGSAAAFTVAIVHLERAIRALGGSPPPRITGRGL